MNLAALLYAIHGGVDYIELGDVNIHFRAENDRLLCAFFGMEPREARVPKWDVDLSETLMERVAELAGKRPPWILVVQGCKEDLKVDISRDVVIPFYSCWPRWTRRRHLWVGRGEPRILRRALRFACGRVARLVIDHGLAFCWSPTVAVLLVFPAPDGLQGSHVDPAARCAASLIQSKYS